MKQYNVNGDMILMLNVIEEAKLSPLLIKVMSLIKNAKLVLELFNYHHIVRLFFS